MVNFIICEDNKKWNEKICNIIDKIMIKNNYAYQKYIYFDYNQDFEKIVRENLPNKIYMLDVETPSSSGIDIARQIRKNDVDSVINFITSHNEIGNLLLKERIMFLSFICKFDDMKKRLIQTINDSLKMTNLKQAIRFEEGGVVYTIPLTDILYVTTDTVSRKTIIVTNYTQFKVNKSLKEIMIGLDARFIQTHRACIVNMDKVIKIDKRKNIIFFEKVKINLLSNKYKKGI